LHGARSISLFIGRLVSISGKIAHERQELHLGYGAKTRRRGARPRASRHSPPPPTVWLVSVEFFQEAR